MSVNSDVTANHLGAPTGVPLVVDRVEVLNQGMSALSLEEPDAIAELLAVSEKDASEKEGASFKNVRVLTVSDLSGDVLCRIFCFLDRDGAQCAALVCRDWNQLHAYPSAQVPIKIFCWGAKLQSQMTQETRNRTSCNYLSENTVKPQLSRFCLDDYPSPKSHVSVSEVFVRTDAVNSKIAREKHLLSEELKCDPLLKGLLEEVFTAEKEHALGYQPFYHAATTNVFFFGFATKMLLQVMNQSAEASESLSQFSPVHWFRFPQLKDSVFPVDVQKFLAEYPMTKMEAGSVDKSAVDKNGYNDHDNDVKQWLLSVSPLIFSNIHCSGESTWELFLQNKSVYAPDDIGYFNALCDHFHLLPNPSIREKYAQEFSDLLGSSCRSAGTFLRRSRPLEQRTSCEWQDRGNRNLGFLFQIFVPKPLVDTVVYPCKGYGLPMELEGCKISKIYQQISQDPTALNNVEVQARMLTCPLVTPGNQIKVMTYGHNNFLQSPDGMAVAKKFQEFFLNVVLDSQI
ncbi:MAG: hypothetical protein JSR39_07765 [Verrucomicrobia bacterium]|nr:hypothetical protein [Verrucomicrobiota bacterium]